MVRDMMGSARFSEGNGGEAQAEGAFSGGESATARRTSPRVRLRPQHQLFMPTRHALWIGSVEFLSIRGGSVKGRATAYVNGNCVHHFRKRFIFKLLMHHFR